MKMRATVLLCALAAMPAAAPAQTAVWTWTWIHIDPVTFAPITFPQDPAAVSPGEAAELRGSLTITGQGMIVTNHANQTGVIEGLAITTLGFNAAPGHGGFFTGTVYRNPPYVGGGPPFVEPDRIRGIAIGQFPLPGLPLNFTQSHFENALRIRWVPIYYEERTAEFFPTPSEGSTVVPTGFNFAIDITGNFDWASYRVPSENITWGTLEVPIIPTPSSFAIISASGVLLLRRRR